MLTAAALNQADLAILVVGSQSVLGADHDDALPDRATLSMEADVMYVRDGRYEAERRWSSTIRGLGGIRLLS